LQGLDELGIVAEVTEDVAFAAQRVRSRRIIGSRTVQISPIIAVTSRRSLIRMSITPPLVLQLVMRPPLGPVAAGYPADNRLLTLLNREEVAARPAEILGTNIV
jgi:hypothetical protein